MVIQQPGGSGIVDGTEPYTSLCTCTSCEDWRWIHSPDFIGPRPYALRVDDFYSPWKCIGPVCQRDGKTHRFRVRIDSGLCEFCTAFSARQAVTR